MTDLLAGKFVRNERVISAALDDELVLLNIESDRYFGSGPVGLRVWELFEESRTFDELVACLLVEFEVEESICREEVRAFVCALLERQLLIPVG